MNTSPTHDPKHVDDRLAALSAVSAAIPRGEVNECQRAITQARSELAALWLSTSSFSSRTALAHLGECERRVTKAVARLSRAVELLET